MVTAERLSELYGVPVLVEEVRGFRVVFVDRGGPEGAVPRAPQAAASPTPPAAPAPKEVHP